MTDDVAVLDALRDAILDGEFAAGQDAVQLDASRVGSSGSRRILQLLREVIQPARPVRRIRNLAERRR